MMRTAWTLLLAALLAPAAVSAPRPADAPPFTRKQDVIYGRKDGTALTLDVFTPTAKANRAAVIHVISGGWYSSHDGVNPGVASIFTRRGYTVFAIVHGSNPRYTIPDVLQDMHRAVRFIRSHAKEYGIDPERIGITGGSAGGHLSLMQGTAGTPGNPQAKDAVERASSRVQAVACFFPPTDFLNYGEKGKDVLHFKALEFLQAAFDFREFDQKMHKFERVTDPRKVQDIFRQTSPITHVSADDPPMLIVHGDKDRLVPVQQVEEFAARCKEVGVPVRLIIKPGADHGWQGMDKDLGTFADWFDQHLLKKAPALPRPGANAVDRERRRPVIRKE
jgi:acetyl esterase/lipase